MAMELKVNSDFTLKSCMRIRATGYSQQSELGLFGTLRLEAVLPNMSFQAVSVKAVAFLNTPLANKLMETNNNNSASLGPKFGYLTMNQTRKLVPMTVSDPSVSLSPIVGIWTKIDTLDSNSEQVYSNPFVWGACIKYMASDKILERAFISPYTFMLVSITLVFHNLLFNDILIVKCVSAINIFY
jgi:SCL-interrupting locus protein N-terminus